MGKPKPPTTPPGWYPSPSGDGGQRYWDGANWTAAGPPPPGPPAAAEKKRRKWPWILAAVVALIVIISALSNGGSNNGGSTTAGSSSTPTAPPSPSATSNPATTSSSAVTPTTSAAPAAAGLNQPVRDGKFEFVVTGMRTAKTVGDPSNEYMQATAQGEYVVVSMTVRNIGDESQAFFAENQKMKDANGREYSPDSTADMYMNSAIQTDINPGNQVQAQVAFDVPSGTRPYQIEVHDSAFSGGATVDLK